MARKASENTEVERLIALSAAYRDHLENGISTLRQRLDVPARLHGSVTKNPSKWVAGSAVVGLVGTFLFRRRRGKKSVVSAPLIRGVEKPSRGLFGIIFALVFAALKPFLQDLLMDHLRSWIAGKNPSLGNGLLARLSQHKF